MERTARNLRIHDSGDMASTLPLPPGPPHGAVSAICKAVGWNKRGILMVSSPTKRSMVLQVCSPAVRRPCTHLSRSHKVSTGQVRLLLGREPDPAPVQYQLAVRGAGGRLFPPSKKIRGLSSHQPRNLTWVPRDYREVQGTDYSKYRIYIL